MAQALVQGIRRVRPPHPVSAGLRVRHAAGYGWAIGEADRDAGADAELAGYLDQPAEAIGQALDDYQATVPATLASSAARIGLGRLRASSSLIPVPLSGP
jgi:hypothetical protein